MGTENTVLDDNQLYCMNICQINMELVEECRCAMAVDRMLMLVCSPARAGLVLQPYISEDQVMRSCQEHRDKRTHDGRGLVCVSHNLT